MKRGEMTSSGTAVALIIAALLIVATAWFLTDGFQKTEKPRQGIFAQISAQGCEASSLNNPGPDGDGDGLRNDCDPCLGGKLDQDGDGVQDLCQALNADERTGSLEKQCEARKGNIWNEQTQQCRVPGTAT